MIDFFVKLKRVKIWVWFLVAGGIFLSGLYFDNCRFSRLEYQELKKAKTDFKNLQKTSIAIIKQAEAEQKARDVMIMAGQQEIDRLKQSYAILAKDTDQIKTFTAKELKKLNLDKNQLLSEHEKKDNFIDNLKSELSLQIELSIQAEQLAESWKQKFLLKLKSESEWIELYNKCLELNQKLSKYKQKKQFFAVVLGTGLSNNGFQPIQLTFGLKVL